MYTGGGGGGRPPYRVLIESQPPPTEVRLSWCSYLPVCPMGLLFSVIVDILTSTGMQCSPPLPQLKLVIRKPPYIYTRCVESDRYETQINRVIRRKQWFQKKMEGWNFNGKKTPSETFRCVSFLNHCMYVCMRFTTSIGRFSAVTFASFFL